MELDQLEYIELLTGTVASQAVYLNVLFPSGYRYYFELVGNTLTPILIDHPFRLYFPETVLVEWAASDNTGGIYLTLGSNPAFPPFGSLTVQIYIPQDLYNAIVTAMENPIESLTDLVPPVGSGASGEMEFVLLSTEEGYQIKVDLVNTYYTPEIPVTVKTLQWNEILYDIMNVPLSPPPPPSSVLLPPTPTPSFEFAYTASGDLGITFIDPRFCFLREWVQFPDYWTSAIKDFAGV